MVYKLGKLIGKGSDGVVYELISETGKDRVIKFIQSETSIHVNIAENPLECVALGTGKALSEIDILRKVLISE